MDGVATGEAMSADRVVVESLAERRVVVERGGERGVDPVCRLLMLAVCAALSPVVIAALGAEWLLGVIEGKYEVTELGIGVFPPAEAFFGIVVVIRRRCRDDPGVSR